LVQKTPVKFSIVPLFRALERGLTVHQRQDDPDNAAQATRVLAFSLSMLVWVPVFAVIYTVLGAPICSNVILSGGAILIGILMLLRRGVSPEACGNLLTGAAWYVYTAIACLTGGLWAPVMIWFATLPILSVLLSGPRAGAFWTATSAATVGWFALADRLGWSLPVELPADSFFLVQSSGLVGLLFCVFLLVSVLKKMEFGARLDLRNANSKLERQAATDGLTGIPNRHSFDCILAQEWSRHERARVPLSIALIDADFFKAFNDEYGHLAGDDCLRAVARAIKASIRRPSDFCARFGGEEFVIILPNTDEAGAVRVAEVVRTRVRSIAIPHPRSTVDSFVTVSIGVATVIPTSDRSRQDFLHDVDMALSRAKEPGRDRIIQVAPDLVHPVC
jgi:diguanylate cyclase (GGDEF)-like protein